MKYIFAAVGFVLWFIVPHIKTGEIYFWRNWQRKWAPIDFVETYEQFPDAYMGLKPDGVGHARVLRWFGMMFVLKVHGKIKPYERLDNEK